MDVTTKVDLGGELTAEIRRPDFATWFEYEDLINGRYFTKTKEQEQEERLAREEALVKAYEQREGTADQEDAAKKRPVVIRKFTREEARQILEFVQNALIPNALVALREGDAEIERFLTTDGARVGECASYLRGIGPDRCMELASAISDFVRAGRRFSFREWRLAQTGEGASDLVAGAIHG